MQKNNLKAFTLVELIVVITIVGILSTIGFVSYSGYLTGARDSNRTSQMVKLSDSLQVYSATKSLPLPDNYVEIEASGSLIAYQGEVGVDVLETIDYTNGGTDPKDGSYYTYYLTKDRNSMQLMAMMEEQSLSVQTDTSLNSGSAPANARVLLQGEMKLYAADYEDRFAKVYGRKLGTLTQETTNTPIQQLSTFSSSPFEVTTETGYTAHISDSEKIVGTVAGDLQASIKNGSCKRIKQTGGSRGNGTYTINPAGTDISVYCDMESDGGGWTALVTFNPSINNSNYWDTNVGTQNSNGEYNFLNLISYFSITDIYVNKETGFDGGEFVFEKVGSDLYARRGFFKDVLIKEDWPGITTNLSNWLALGYSSGGFDYNSVNYPYIGHTNTEVSLYDFPFSDQSTSVMSGTEGHFSDNTWGGRYYDDNETVYIFIK